MGSFIEWGISNHECRGEDFLGSCFGIADEVEILGSYRPVLGETSGAGDCMER